MSHKNQKTIDISKVKPDPNQPRQSFDKDKLNQLKKSVTEWGILNPLHIEEKGDGTYSVLDGERRYRVAKELGLTEVPYVLYEALSPQERMIRRFHLQEQHSAWSAFDKASAIALLQKDTGLTLQEIADALGMNSGTVYSYLSILNISKRGQKRAMDLRIPYSAIRGIGRTMESYKNGENKLRVEEALLDRYERGIITKVRDMESLSRAAGFDPKGVLASLTKNPDYTAQEIMIDAGVKDVELMKTVSSYTKMLLNLIERAEKTGNVTYDDEAKGRFKSLIAELNKHV